MFTDKIYLYIQYFVIVRINILTWFRVVNTVPPWNHFKLVYHKRQQQYWLLRVLVNNLIGPYKTRKHCELIKKEIDLYT